MAFFRSLWRGILAATETPAERRQRARQEASERRQAARREAAERKRARQAQMVTARRERREEATRQRQERRATAVKARQERREDESEYRQQVAAEKQARKRRPGGRAEVAEWERLAPRFLRNPARDPDVRWLLGTLRRNPSPHLDKAMGVLKGRHGEAIAGRLLALEYRRPDGTEWRHEAGDTGSGTPAQSPDRLVIGKGGAPQIKGPMRWRPGRGFVG